MTSHRLPARTRVARAIFPATLRLSAAALLLGVPILGCSTDELLRVQDPDVATPGSLRSKEALPVVLAGALGDFHVAYQGPGDGNESSGQIGYSGLLADEFRSSDTFPTRNEIDQRTIQLENASNEAEFVRLSRARASADLAVRRYAEFDPAAPEYALAYALDGYATALFGENYCSGVPFSTLTDAGELQYGQPLATADIFQRAIEKFDAALGTSGIDSTFTYLAKIGKARAQLNLGQYAEAAATVAGVPTDFVYYIESSENTSRQNNGVWTFNVSVGRLSVADSEGGNGLGFISAGDPRVPTEDAEDTGFDGVTPLFYTGIYTDRASPAILASGLEARLIEAEAQLASGGNWLGTLNSLRGSPPAYSPAAGATLTPLVDPVTPAARVDLLFRERAFWLAYTSHRLGDMRRLIRQYGRNSESIFPTGEFPKGGSYGSDVNLPVPVVEQNNPNFSGCIDRNA